MEVVWPFGASLRGAASNHRALRPLTAVRGERSRKRRAASVSGVAWEDGRKYLPLTRRNHLRWHQNQGRNPASGSVSDLRKSVRSACLSRSSTSDGVGDGAGVAGDVRRGVVDLLEEQGEGSGKPWCGGLVEFDVDCAAVVGDGAAEVEEGAGGGPVLVGVLEVGVEVVGEPVFGVGGEQAEDHLQAAAGGAVDGSFGVGVDEVGG